MDVQMQLVFNSQEPTPSGQLSNPFDRLCLNSQQPSQQLAPQHTQERRPVPLFSEDVALPCSQQVEMGSQEVLGTQDFITPVDQFGLDYDPGNKVDAAQRSPARLSPNRSKRPRKDDSVAGEDTPELRPAGRPESQPPGRVVPRRTKSPPCYRNMFDDDEGDDGFPAWNAPRGGQPESWFKAHFKEIGHLGQGNYSRVYRVRHRLNGKEFAIKRSIRELRPDNPAFAQFIQEAQVLVHIPPHPHIVQYYTSWTELGKEGGEFLFHQLEKCDISLGSLAALREAVKEPDMLLEVLRQMCLALAHLHSHGVAHLDLKPDNIYTLGGEDSEAPRVFKLGDFGQAMRLNCQGGVTLNEGDCRYLPLEVLNSDYRALDKADMFSLGMTLFELCSRNEPPSNGQQYQDLRHGKVPLLPSVSTSLLKLIRSLLSFNPEDRPSAERVLASPLLQRRPSATLQPQGSTMSTQSVQSGDTRLGGLVLQRSVHS